MRKINNKGYTLVELIATIIILAIVMGIGAYSITHIIKKSKEKDYELLVENIYNAVELYYQECKYSKSDAITCPSLVDNYYTITLGDLVTNGFLKGNSTIETNDPEDDDNDKLTLVNPNDNQLISDCSIKYQYNSGKIAITPNGQNSTSSCPESY